MKADGSFDEQEWADARDLANAFGEMYSERPAWVLAAALHEALSELMDVQMAEPCKACASVASEFLEGEEAYAAAPVGTKTDDDLERREEGWWDLDKEEAITSSLVSKRKVILWGQG